MLRPAGRARHGAANWFMNPIINPVIRVTRIMRVAVFPRDTTQRLEMHDRIR